MSEPDLQRIRDAIEQLDRRLLELLKERMALAAEIAAAKISAAAPFRDRLREDHVVRRVRAIAVELGLDAHEIERLYQVVLDMSVAYQHSHVQSLGDVPLRVAYQGVEGSFSHLAAQRRYAGRAGGAWLTGHPSFRAAAAAVRAGEADVALLPIENTTAGSINETYDALAEGGLSITAEVVSSIEHCLLGLPGARLETLRVVLSHPQAIAQCAEFLHGVPWVAPEEVFDTAGAARMVRDRNDATLAAIASESAARTYGLEVLARAIQSQAANFTRFVEIAREGATCPADVPCKTSLLLATQHRPGALGEVLTRFGARGVSLSKLESRPIPGKPWEYRFYLDLEGHSASEPVRLALEDVRPLTSELRVLGSYPKAEPARG